MKIIKPGTLNEIDAKEVEVEPTFTKGLPSFTIVDLASNSIWSSKLLLTFTVNCISKLIVQLSK